LSTTGAAMDHPVHAAYPEGQYLTAILMHVQ
jgi:23S rRNA G2069 N7-methylase RlmK/C1962 C5-methylase RlmI